MIASSLRAWDKKQGISYGNGVYCRVGGGGRGGEEERREREGGGGIGGFCLGHFASVLMVTEYPSIERS